MKIHERIYRTLLKAYSKTFQREYGESMTQLFRDQLKDAIARRKLPAFWKRIVLDLFRTAPASYIPNWRVLVAAACAVLVTFAIAQTSSSQTLWTAHPSSWITSLANEIAYFAVLNTILMSQAFCLFLAITERFSWKRFLRGLLAAMAVFAIGKIATPWQWAPLYAGLAAAMWTALTATTDPTPEAEPHSL
jgi:hypothetical protein